jgi:putative sigma-54 modulation protein
MEITGRHIDITEPLRNFAAERIARLHSGANEIMEAHVVLSVENPQRHTAEIHIKTRHDLHHGHETTADMYTAIAAAAEKVDKQLQRSKGKAESQKRRAQPIGVIAGSSGDAEAAIGDHLPRIVRTNAMAAKPLSVDDAALELGEAGTEFLVFRNAETQRLSVVYKRKDGNVGWIEPEA